MLRELSMSRGGLGLGKESGMPRGGAGSITGFCLAIGKVGERKVMHLDTHFFLIYSFWACLQTRVNAILL